MKIDIIKLYDSKYILENGKELKVEWEIRGGEGKMTNARGRRKERRKQFIKENGFKKRGESLHKLFREGDDEMRAKILRLGIIGEKVGYDEVADAAVKYKCYPLCGYVKSRYEIDGKKFGICALADFVDAPKVCEFEFPMIPLDNCKTHQLFQRCSGSRPTGMYIVKDNLSFLKLYFKWGREEVAGRIFMNRGVFGSRLNQIVIDGICTHAEVYDGVIKETFRAVTPKELSRIKTLTWGSSSDFPRRLYQELNYVLSKGDYRNLKIPGGLKGKVRYASKTPRSGF